MGLLYIVFNKMKMLDSDNNKFINYFKFLGGLTAIFAIIISIMTYYQTKFLNRPIAKIIVPQLHKTFSKDDNFQIQLHNRGESPLTKVKVYYKIFSCEGDTLLNNEIKTGQSYFNIVDEKDAKGFIADFKISDLKNPDTNWLFVVIGIQSPDFFGRDNKIIIFYGDLSQKKWWETNERLFVRLSDGHRIILKNSIKEVEKKLNEKWKLKITDTRRPFVSIPIKFLRYAHRLGLVFNFIGAIIIAFSIGRLPEGGYQEDKKRRKIHLVAIVHPVAFAIGITFLIIGFALQFIYTLA